MESFRLLHSRSAPESDPLKKIFVAILKIGGSAAILGYLIWDAHQNAAFQQLREQPKNWALLLCALAACAAAVVLTLLRWCFLVRRLGLALEVRDALRLGFLGFLFNFAPMGIVGGDLLRAILLGRREGQRAEALASVMVDRAIGLYLLFVVASAAILASGLWSIPSEQVQWICRATLIVTAAATVAVVWVLVPDLSHGRWKPWLERVPYVGPPLLRLVNAIEAYREKRLALLLAAGITLCVHSLFAVGIFLIARGLYRNVPPVEMHFVVSPLAASAGVIPLPVGPYEFVLDRLYVHMPVAGGPAMQPGQGLVVALCYRIVTVAIAAIGISYYLAGREEIRGVLEQGKDDPPSGSASDEVAARTALR
jgi:hypothetical protein